MPPMDAEDGSSPSGITVHVLCPSLPPPNRFTFDDLPLSITVADLKSCITKSVPSHPTPGSQKLLYLGKILSKDDVTLQSLFEPLNGSEFSVHLVLPPSATQPTESAKPTTNAPYPSAQPNHSRNHGLNEQQLRYRSPNPLRRDEIAQSLHENARLRLAEMQHMQSVQRSSIFAQQQLSHRPSYMPGPMVGFGDGIQLPEDAQPRLRLLKQYISLAEEQLNCGIAPTIDHVIQLRTHLFKILDDQLRRPLSERGEFIEPLITRVFDISTRADELRRAHILPLQTGISHGPTAPLYLVSAPGYQGLIRGSSAAADAVRALGTTQTAGTPSVVDDAAAANLPPNADAAVMENVVRQAVLQQEPAADGQLGLGRNLRRLWLFIRLYFFCHMFSMPGTQTRLIYVTLAVIAAILSETTVPRRTYEMILAPVQRHLEGLVHFTPEEPHQETGTARDEATANQHVGVQPGRAGGIYRNLQRVERSAALFIASLVPGVGERHIEVRNAAEAARHTELARQEEERRRREEEAAAPATEEQPPEANNATSGSEQGAQANLANQHQPAIPQEVH
ncbi:uncharacterized protein BDV17DRAFT_8405 [Aspergillus undulatus]|uniref:uncharacterized protein n=1 Tax=Aspergillus undulatus TaxID=1810928 RepID=UPI003CCD2F19